MMTKEEQITHRALQRVSLSVTDHLTKTDWERRRYETARELLPGRMSACCGNADQAVREAVGIADKLIEELKRTAKCPF